jgi:hypothetical protein
LRDPQTGTRVLDDEFDIDIVSESVFTHMEVRVVIGQCEVLTSPSTMDRGHLATI